MGKRFDDGIESWLTAANLNYTQLMKRAVWSMVKLQESHKPDDSVLSTDFINNLEEVTPASDAGQLYLGLTFSTNLLLLSYLNNEIHAFRNHSKLHQNMLPFCIHRHSLCDIAKDEVYSRPISSIHDLADNVGVWRKVDRYREIMISNSERIVMNL